MKKILALILFTFLIAALSSMSVDNLIQRGKVEFREGRYTSARDYFLDAIKKSEVKTPEHCYWLGKAYVALQDYENAYIWYNYYSENHLGENSLNVKKLVKILKREANACDSLGSYFTLERLPNYMNSKFSDSAPVLSSDGNVIYFTSEKLSKNNENIWKSIKVKEKWTKPVLIKELSTTKNESVASISNDGDTIYLFGNYSDGEDAGRGSIYLADKNKEIWNYPKKIDELSSKFVEMHPFVYKDSLLFFTSINDECYGGSDIYVSEKKDQKWGSPINLGSIVNTVEYEQTPFLDFDGRTLYFASNGHPGFGGFDIFKTTKIGDTWQDWTEPVNIGVRLNSVRDDRYFKKIKNTDIGYISSTRINGRGQEDIYSFISTKIRLPEKTEEIAEKVTIYGKITCETIPANKLTIDEFVWNYTKDDVMYHQMVEVDTTGSYRVALHNGAQLYKATINTNRCFTSIANIVVDSKMESYEYNVILTELIEDKSYEIKDINFEFNKAILTKDSFFALDKLAETLKNNSKYHLEITGHTDNVGSNEYNMALSIKRAAAVKNYLIKAEVNKEKLISKGFGEEKPKETNDTKENRAKNRRVEIKFSNNEKK